MSWIGISPDEMKSYTKYINRQQPGYCGSYATAGLIHYALRQQGLSFEAILEALEEPIEKRFPYRGSLPWDIIWTLRELVTGSAYDVHWRLFSEMAVKESLSGKNPLPVIVGTMHPFSTYGNHWLLVYAYQEKSRNSLIYRAWDNHGKHAVEIPASQTTLGIYLTRGNFQ